MSKVNMQSEFSVSPDKLWKLIGGFNALPDWHPAVESSNLEEGGIVRRLHLVDGSEVVERLEQLDDNEHIYSYSILNSPLPVADYTATIRVRGEGDPNKSVIEWSSQFDADGASEQDATQAIRDIYMAGFDNLKKMFGG